MQNNIMKKKVLVYCESKDRFKFYLRFNKALFKKNYELFVITNRLSVFIHAIFLNIKSKLIQKTGSDFAKYENEFQYDPTPEILSKNLTTFQASILYHELMKILDSNKEELKDAIVFIHNGMRTIDRALVKYSDKMNLKKIFIEFSNLPNKLFFDPKGTNMNSLLYSDIHILDNFSVNDETYAEWLSNYLKFKTNQETIPQRYLSRRIINFHVIIDFVGWSLLGVIKDDYKSFFKRLYLKLRLNLVKVQYTQVNFEDNNYIFLPLQVSNDTQLLFNSLYRNLGAIRFAMHKAKEENCKLVVKIHPAETDYGEIIRIKKLSKRLGFEISNQNTFSLLKNAKSVVTINSTAGLEAIILHKEVVFLGKSFYKYLTINYLQNYICKYLIDVDYFDSGNITEEQLNKIFNRTSLEVE